MADMIKTVLVAMRKLWGLPLPLDWAGPWSAGPCGSWPEPTLGLVAFKWTRGLLVPCASVGAASSGFTCWFLLDVSWSCGLRFFALWEVATPPGQLSHTHIHILHITNTQSHTITSHGDVITVMVIWDSTFITLHITATVFWMYFFLPFHQC